MHPSFEMGSLPADLRRYLLLGSTGRLHLHGAAEVALHHAHRPGDPLSVVAGDLLLAAWGENPFDGNCAAALASNSDKLPPLGGELMVAVKAVLSHWQPDITPEAREAMAGEPAAQLAFLRQKLTAHPESLFWWHHLYEFCRINGRWSVLVEALAQASPPGALSDLFSYARANALLAAGDTSGAHAVYSHVIDVLPLPVMEERLATALLRLGRADEAAAVLRRCILARPWNVSPWLRLHELIMGGANRTSIPAGRTMVLAYSWNKADDLAATLASLAASELGEAVHVRILDNGSTDHTPEVIRQFADGFGADRVKAVSLPVNVGAPAARNWLMHLPEMRESSYAAFIDDDIELPPDWLGKLGEATKRYPEAGVWGCKVVDFDGPARVQCGEHNLTPDPSARQESLMATLMLQDGDFGQADYVRPCASVTGCVHLFRTDRLLECGDFDLRFSPTQYDDLERDLRMVAGGGHAVYTGHLAIRHKRSSGRLSDAGRPESGSAAANMHKLSAKYTAKEFESMAERLDAVLLKDLENRQRKICG